jgi:molecular chaperone GrpE
MKEKNCCHCCSEKEDLSKKDCSKNQGCCQEGQLEVQTKLAEERLNQLKYLQADFDNYRKKFDKEKEQIIKLANENLVKELIVILDDFDASLKSLESQISKEGIERLRSKFYQILEKHGLKTIESLGKRFDPHFHEVLCKELSESNEDEILEEIQKGYILHSKVIRPSKVKVAKKDDRQNLKTNEVKE